MNSLNRLIFILTLLRNIKESKRELRVINLMESLFTNWRELFFIMAPLILDTILAILRKRTMNGSSSMMKGSGSLILTILRLSALGASLGGGKVKVHIYLSMSRCVRGMCSFSLKVKAKRIGLLRSLNLVMLLLEKLRKVRISPKVRFPKLIVFPASLKKRLINQRWHKKNSRLNKTISNNKNAKY